MDLGVEGLSDAVRVGSGGHATVYAAELLETGERVAVKLLKASADSHQERARFSREQEVLQQLSSHDGIVTLLGSGITRHGEPYFLMPLMDGTVQDTLDEGGPFPWRDAAALMAQVADAVDYAHERDVLHRDIKPGNVLVDADGIPRIADFGLAKLTGASSSTTTTRGTLGYMPLELFNGESATRQSDVYALGATLSALVTGSAPYVTGENDSEVAIITRVMNDDPPDLTVNGVPPRLADLVTRSMSKDATDRPQSASEFAAMLRESADLPVDGRGAGVVTVARSTKRIITISDDATPGRNRSQEDDQPDSRRRPVLWLVAAGVVVVLGVAGVLVALNNRETPVETVSDDLTVTTDIASNPATTTRTMAADSDSDKKPETEVAAAVETLRELSTGDLAPTVGAKAASSSTAPSAPSTAPSAPSTAPSAPSTAPSAPSTAPTTVVEPLFVAPDVTLTIGEDQDSVLINLLSGGATNTIWKGSSPNAKSAGHHTLESTGTFSHGRLSNVGYSFWVDYVLVTAQGVESTQGRITIAVESRPDPIPDPWDLNNDGQLTCADRDYATDLFLNGQYDARADIDGDGDVGLDDASLWIVRFRDAGHCG